MTVHPSLDDPTRFRRAVFAVILLALIARFGVLTANWPKWGWHQGGTPDQWNELAINLVDHHAFAYFSDPTNSSVMRGPIFPFMEVPLYLVFGQNYAGWSISLLLLDTGTCALLMLTARHLWNGKVALLAGMFYALNLPIIYYTADISQVTSVLPFVVLWLYLFTRWEREFRSSWIPWVMGLVTGLMVLNKTVYLPVPFVATAVMLWLKRREIRQLAPLYSVVIYFAVSIGVVAPWTFRNYLVTQGHFVPVQSMFWELMIEDIYYYDLDVQFGRNRPDGASLKYYLAKEDEIVTAAGLPIKPPSGHRAEWEVQRQKAYKDAAITMMKADPGKTIRVKLANLWHYWVRAENWRKTKLFILLQAGPLTAALTGIVLLARQRRLLEIKYGLILILILWGEHCLVWGWGRLSLDLMPALALAFALGVDGWLRTRTTSPTPLAS